MNEVTLKVNQEALVRNLKFGFTSQVTVLGELMQNARRAKANVVAFDLNDVPFLPADVLWSISDYPIVPRWDGDGIEGYGTFIPEGSVEASEVRLAKLERMNEDEPGGAVRWVFAWKENYTHRCRFSRRGALGAPLCEGSRRGGVQPRCRLSRQGRAVRALAAGSGAGRCACTSGWAARSRSKRLRR